MTGHLPISSPRLKVGFILAGLLLSPNYFSQLYVAPGAEVHIEEATVLRGEIIRLSETNEFSETEILRDRSPDSLQEKIRISGLKVQDSSDSSDISRKESVARKEKEKDKVNPQTVFIPSAPESDMSASHKHSAVAVLSSNQESRAAIVYIFQTSVNNLQGETATISSEIFNFAHLLQTFSFSIRPPPGMLI